MHCIGLSIFFELQWGCGASTGADPQVQKLFSDILPYLGTFIYSFMIILANLILKVRYSDIFVYSLLSPGDSSLTGRVCQKLHRYRAGTRSGAGGLVDSSQFRLEKGLIDQKTHSESLLAMNRYPNYLLLTPLRPYRDLRFLPT